MKNVHLTEWHPLQLFEQNRMRFNVNNKPHESVTCHQDLLTNNCKIKLICCVDKTMFIMTKL